MVVKVLSFHHLKQFLKLLWFCHLLALFVLHKSDLFIFISSAGLWLLIIENARRIRRLQSLMDSQ